MRRIAAIAFGLLVSASLSAAQTPDAPATGATPAGGEAAPGDSGKHLTHILVLGDAIGGGLGAGLLRLTEGSGTYDVALRFNEESGIARPEVYDWAATVPKILDSNHYDVIVAMLGANDRQLIRSGEERLAFGSEAWTRAYTAQLDSLLDLFAKSGAKVIWVSPPPMRDPDYDAAVKAISDVQRSRTEAHGMNFLDLRPELSAPDGGYSDTAKDDTGAVIRIRGRDGISFFKAGNNLMAQLVLAAIESGKASAPPAGAAAVAGKGDAEPPKDAPQQRQVPLFGQTVMDAEDYTVSPEGVKANAMLLAGGGLDAQAALQTLRSIAPKGSNAERLFTFGKAAPAPSGRADDFSAPSPASGN